MAGKKENKKYDEIVQNGRLNKYHDVENKQSEGEKYGG